MPLHAVRQQTPCSQKPEEHWLAAVQVAPLAFRPQCPLLQVFGATHWPLSLQVVLQAVPAELH